MHDRLLRSLSWGDEGYAGNALSVIKRIAEQNEKALVVFEQYAAEKHPGDGMYISAKPSERKITFAPNVFQFPESTLIENDLVAAMMLSKPSSARFTLLFAALTARLVIGVLGLMTFGKRARSFKIFSTSSSGLMWFRFHRL